VNQVSPKKLLQSKWTAVQPVKKEKHFLVTEVHEDDAGHPEAVTLEAVHSKRERRLAWRDLKDSAQWKVGWV